jgi:methionyl-tRNA synthetase
VWFDALANYVTAHGYGTDDAAFRGKWPVDYHFIGKDIIRFHCVYWPAMLMSAGLEPPRGWAVGGWLLVGGEKMSKTTGNVVNPLDLIDEVSVDGFRYYVLADTAYGNDGDFTHEGLLARYNADLANNLGNLLSRVATVVGSKCGGFGPAPLADSPLAAAAARAVEDAAAAWDAVQPSRALEATWSLIRAANANLEVNEPWKMEPGPALDAVMGGALEVLRIVAILASPAMPRTCAEILRRIGIDRPLHEARIGLDTAWGGYPGGLTVTKGDPLFPRKKA